MLESRTSHLNACGQPDFIFGCTLNFAGHLNLPAVPKLPVPSLASKEHKDADK